MYNSIHAAVFGSFSNASAKACRQLLIGETLKRLVPTWIQKQPFNLRFAL